MRCSIRVAPILLPRPRSPRPIWLSPGFPQVDRALAFLEETQDERGCWIGRWGVNYLYGTWQVLVGLEAIGYDMDLPWSAKG